MAIMGPIPYGKICTVMSLSPTAGGSKEQYFHIESDSVLLSLFVSSISGTLDVVAYTLTEEGKEVEVIRFPQLSGTTTELLIRKSAVTLSRIRVEATYSAACVFEVRARAIQAGEMSSRVLGARSAKASQIDVTGSPTVLIAASLEDRAGLVIKNHNDSNTLFIGYTALECDPATGYPLYAGEAIAIDLDAGVAIYGQTEGTTIDTRLMEAAQ